MSTVVLTSDYGSAGPCPATPRITATRCGRAVAVARRAFLRALFLAALVSGVAAAGARAAVPARASTRDAPSAGHVSVPGATKGRVKDAAARRAVGARRAQAEGSCGGHPERAIPAVAIPALHVEPVMVPDQH